MSARSLPVLCACLLAACATPVAPPPVTVPADVATTADTAPDTEPTDTGPKPCTTAADCPGQVCDGKACVDCVVSADCPAATDVCLAGACSPQTACQSDKQCAALDLICDAAAGFCVQCLGPEDCAEGLDCKARTCLPPPAACATSKECAPGQVCDKAAKACVECAGPEDCAKGQACVETVCVPQACAPGATRCASAQALETCNAQGLAWTEAPCPGGEVCSNDKCTAEVCLPGAKFCQGNQQMQCNATGTAAALVVDCAGIAGSQQVCLGGACVAQSCTPGSSVCADSKAKATCKADGSGYDTAPCPAGEACAQGKCQEQVCTPGKAACAGTKVVLCNDAGTQATELADCAVTGKQCGGGQCFTKKCEPGSAECQDGEVATCKGDGSGWTKTACGAGTGCVAGKCVAATCVAGAKSCEGGKVVQCDAQGLGTVVVEDCAAKGMACSGGACAQAQACQPGSKQCSGAKLATCKGDGSGWEESACEDGNGCTVDGCSTGSCTHTPMPDGAVCNDGNACTTGEVCTVGQCAAKLAYSVSTLAGSGVKGHKDGPGTAAQFNIVTGLAGAPDGGVYVGDAAYVRHVASNGTVSTVLGNGIPNSVDGPAASAQVNDPYGLKLTLDGTLWFTEGQGRRIRKLAPDGAVTTVAGSGAQGFSDGPALSAKFGSLSDLAVGSDGTLWMMDRFNHRLRVLSGGVVSTLSGTGQAGSLDGPVGNATFAQPNFVVRDAAGTLYISEYEGQRIRIVTAAGFVTTLAGSTCGYADGKGATAKLCGPHQLAWLPDGSLAVTDFWNHRIRRIALDGTVTTIAGSGTAGFADGAATVAAFSKPLGLTVGLDGTMYVSDSDNFRIRRISSNVVACIDGNPCTTDSCNPATGKCVFAPVANGTGCGSGQVCKDAKCGSGQ